MGLIKPFIVTFLALFVLDWLLPNITTGDWVTLFIASLVLTVLTGVVKPILGVFLLPISIITLGLFNTVLTVFLMWLAVALVPGFHIDPVRIGGYWLGQWVVLLVFSFSLTLIKNLILRIWR